MSVGNRKNAFSFQRSRHGVDQLRVGRSAPHVHVMTERGELSTQLANVDPLPTRAGIPAIREQSYAERLFRHATNILREIKRL